MAPKKTFDLRARRNPVAGEITGVDGKDYQVLKFTGEQYELASQMGEATPATFLYELVGEVVPTMPKEERLKLLKEECQQILIIAGQGIEAVEALFPNELSPEPPTSPG